MYKNISTILESLQQTRSISEGSSYKDLLNNIGSSFRRELNQDLTSLGAPAVDFDNSTIVPVTSPIDLKNITDLGAIFFFGDNNSFRGALYLSPISKNYYVFRDFRGYTVARTSSEAKKFFKAYKTAIGLYNVLDKGNTKLDLDDAEIEAPEPSKLEKIVDKIGNQIDKIARKYSIELIPGGRGEKAGLDRLGYSGSNSYVIISFRMSGPMKEEVGYLLYDGKDSFYTELRSKTMPIQYLGDVKKFLEDIEKDSKIRSLYKSFVKQVEDNTKKFKKQYGIR